MPKKTPDTDTTQEAQDAREAGAEQTADADLVTIPRADLSELHELLATLEARFGAEDEEITMPNLAGVATEELVDTQQGGGGFAARYINWSRTAHLLRTHAPGWLPFALPTTGSEGDLVHRASVGGYLLIAFRHMQTGAITPAVPQAIMDHKNNSVAFEKISARDVSDTFVRGMCKAAALTFGLAYELWAKLPLESGYSSDHEDKPQQEQLPDDPVAYEHAINNAPDVNNLRAAFALAWKWAEKRPNRDGLQARFKELYDGRNIDLTEGGA